MKRILVAVEFSPYENRSSRPLAILADWKALPWNHSRPLRWEGAKLKSPDVADTDSAQEYKVLLEGRIDALLVDSGSGAVYQAEGGASIISAQNVPSRGTTNKVRRTPKAMLAFLNYRPVEKSVADDPGDRICQSEGITHSPTGEKGRDALLRGRRPVHLRSV